MNIISPNPKIPEDPNIIRKFLEGIVKIGKYVWSVITGKDETQDKIAEEKGINPQKSEANEIAELNKLLTDYRQGIISAGNNLEREMIVECCVQIQEIMDIFEEYNQNLKVARSELIRRKFKRMSKDIQGTFSDYISKKISLDDSECIKVLKLPAGELKSQRLQEMKQNVFIAAGNAIIDKIKDTVDDFSETVEDAFEEHLERAEQSVQDKMDIFEKISASDGNADETEKIIMETEYILAVCSYADMLL